MLRVKRPMRTCGRLVSTTPTAVRALFLILLASVDSARGAEWVHFNRGDDISGVAQVGPDLWIGTHGGLVRFDPDGGTRQFFNKANSGLRKNAISGLTVDPSGGLWMTSKWESIVQRYDGSQWTAIDVEDSGLSGDPYSIDVAFGPSGRSWFGTPSGLAVLQGDQWHTFDGDDFGIPPERGITSSWVESIVVAPSGDLWVAVTPLTPIPHGDSYAGGLAHFDGTTWTGYDRRNSPLPSNYISSLVVDAHGVLWMGMYGGLVAFDGNQWRIYNSSNSQLPADGASELNIDSQGALWMLSGYKLVRFDGTNWELYDLPELRQFDSFTGLWVDASDRVWLGTNISGLARLEGNGWSFHEFANSGLPTPRNYSSSEVNALGVDPSNRVWISTGIPGIVRYDRGIWTTFDPESSGFPTYIGCVAIDPAGRPWVAGYSWLGYLEGDSWHVYTEALGVPRGDLRAIDFAPGNVVWFVVFGLVRFDGTHWTHYTRSNSPLPTDAVYDVKVDRDGAVWAATFDGLARLSGTQWTVFNTGNSPMPTNYVSQLALAPDGALWIGMHGALMRYDGSNWTLYDSSNSPLGPDVIHALVFDREGVLWIGAWTGPLYRFDGTNWRVFTPENSALPGLGIQALAVDQYNNKWIASSEGTLAVYREDGLGGTVPVLVQNLTGMRTPAGVEISWRLAGEAVDTVAGVDVQAAAGPGGTWEARTPQRLAPAPSMLFVDSAVSAGGTLYYRLVLRLRTGADVVVGPVEVPPDAQAHRTMLEVPSISTGERVRILYTLADPRAVVNLAVYDARGRIVRVLEDTPRDSGNHEAWWDRLDSGGLRTARGMYFVRLKAGGVVLARKLAVVQ